MCWRWEVSLVSASLEWLLAAYLYNRPVDERDQRYARFVSSIATMESLQGLLWWFALADADVINPANYWLSLGIWFSAWVQIPLSMVFFCPPIPLDGDDSKYSALPPGSPAPTDSEGDAAPRPSAGASRLRVRCFSLYFVLQALFVLRCQGLSGNMYTLVGPNHHQIWACSSGLHWFGMREDKLSVLQEVLFLSSGLPSESSPLTSGGSGASDGTSRFLQRRGLAEEGAAAAAPAGGARASARQQPGAFSHHSAAEAGLLGESPHYIDARSWLNECTLICGWYNAMVAASVWPLRPKFERNGFMFVGGVSFLYTYYMLNATLEACSVWCWFMLAEAAFFLYRRTQVDVQGVS